LVSKEMYVYLKRNSKVLIDLDVEEDEKEKEAPEPSSGTKYKHAKKKVAQATVSSFTVSSPPKPTKSVSAMLCKSPEQVVAERHKNKTSQPTLEHYTKKGKEAKQVVDDHVADFLYENKIPLNVVNSRSWEVILESIGQYRPGYRDPSYHEAMVPWL
jgi:hypothetical protein